MTYTKTLKTHKILNVAFVSNILLYSNHHTT